MPAERSESRRPTHEVGIDIGGTFTDLVMIDETGAIAVGKVLTTSDNPATGATVGLTHLLDRGAAGGENLKRIVHGTTLAANLIARRAGSTVGLITSSGFRDTLEIGRGYRYDPYVLALDFPEPLVPRDRRIEVPERTLADGTVLISPERADVVRAAEQLLAMGVEAIAVSFLHSYLNPAHERRARDWISEVAPEVDVAISSEVAPEIGEFERTSTVVADAYVWRGVHTYIRELQQTLSDTGYRRPLHLLSSSGATLSADMAGNAPIKLLESGPAAGVIAAGHVASLKGIDGLVAFDMGGTTAKLSVIESREPDIVGELEVARLSRLKPGSGIPIRTASVSLLEIGAGGGSIAQVGPGGALSVGPDSAEAVPGPACYGQGGSEPTVTDANLVLGYLAPDHFLGGEMALQLEPARSSIERRVARPLGIETIAAAVGVRRVVTETMSAALKTHCAERGKDRRNLALLAYGGAGPMHAALLARGVGIGRVVVPRFCGVLSAFGMLLAPIAQHVMRSYATELSDIDWGHVADIYSEMEKGALRDLLEAGVDASRIHVSRTADMSYVGQPSTVSVPIPPGELGPSQLSEVHAAFERTYARENHRLLEGRSVSCKTWRSIVAGPAPIVAMPAHDEARLGDLRPRASRLVHFVSHPEGRPCPVFHRSDLIAGDAFEGPAIVEDRESTIVVEPGDTATVDEYGSVVIDIGSSPGG